MIIPTKCNLRKQRQFQTDDRRCHDQQQGGTQKNYAKMATARVCLIVASRSAEQDLNEIGL